MIKGVRLDYKLKRGSSSVFNQKMFGRISTRKRKAVTHAYYVPGVLDNIPHYRVFKGRIFIAYTNFINFDPIIPFCTKFKLSPEEKDEAEIFLRTGKERWQQHAKERGYKIDF
jgi:hypothetical protein